jgi:hypothetical protein
MGNEYLPSSKRENRIRESRLQDDDCIDADMDTDVVLLLEENARLRALVTQLSGLVLKHVVDEK